ncbi:efflux RND transporter periplasmic adaptor subunit [Ideonella sp. B508-1]|uniref:efflux RND transporter periplasmic adaptor subunit n=1 Tax=Ideonella sp. B508-1 TaxID=137716 RepID=UPI000349538D|nr:efflux RND transporter periplasmic adaptor subunit [Ideonella sp. B508-1]
MDQRLQRTPLALAAAAALLCLGIGLSACSSKSNETPTAPATDVGVFTVSAQSLPLTTELPGRTVALQSAEIRPQVSGIIQKRLFTEGSEVQAGQPLYQLDAASYDAAVRSAEADVAKAQATLAAARLTAQRQQALRAADASSQQTLEDAQAALKEDEAALLSAQATLASARIDLARTRITSPIAGRVDTSSVTEGALVTASQTTALTTVQRLDPINVDIPQSSVDLLKLRQQLGQGGLKDGSARIRLVLEDGSAYAHEGTLKVNGVSVNTGTGAVTLRATVPNPEHVLLPGMYVHAVLTQAVDPAALLVPQAGVQRNASGAASALVVGADGKVEQRPVTVAQAIGNQWRVTQGLQAGDRVIVEGVAKVRPGQVVHAVPTALGASAPAAASAASR